MQYNEFILQKNYTFRVHVVYYMCNHFGLCTAIWYENDDTFNFTTAANIIIRHACISWLVTLIQTNR